MICNFYSKFTMQRTFLISFLLVFTFSLITEVFNMNVLGCTVVKHRAETSTLCGSSIISEKKALVQIFNSEKIVPFQAPVHKSDSDCPIHRTHCCGSLAMLDKVDRPHILNIKSAQTFFELIYTVKAAPFLEGPFQPPRA